MRLPFCAAMLLLASFSAASASTFQAKAEGSADVSHASYMVEPIGTASINSAMDVRSCLPDDSCLTTLSADGETVTREFITGLEAPSRSVLVSSTIAMWGDSLTSQVADDLSRATNRPVFDGGVGGESTERIAARMLADSLHKNEITILWDRSYTGQKMDDYLPQIDQMVESLRHDHFVILGDIWKPVAEGPETNARKRVLARNAALATKYPNNFIDVAPLLDDPSTRRDDLHLSEVGVRIVVDAIAGFVRDSGW